MIEILLVGISVALLVLFIMARLRNFKWEMEYLALDQGFDEMVDNYEQQFLTFNETILDLTTERNDLLVEKKELEAHLERHDRECLPNTFDASWRPHVTAPEDVDPPLFQG